MKINKEIRQISKEMLRASFTDDHLDRGKITSVVESVAARRPRNYLDILQRYKRLLRIEIEKRHAKIESAMPLGPATASAVVERLKKKYGTDLTTEFAIDQTLLGGMRVRVGSDVWDGTLRARLKRLEQEL